MQKFCKNFKYIFWTFIIFLLTVLQLSHPRFDSDNGIFLSGAWNLFNNLDVYKDFFSFTSPGTYYLLSAIWKIFGVSYLAAWLCGFVLLLFSVILVYKIASRFNGFVAYLSVILFSLATLNWSIITSHIFCLPFVFGSIYSMIIFLDSSKIKSLYVAGFLAGISVLFLQTVGLATFIGLLIFLLTIFFDKNYKVSRQNIIYFIVFFSLPILAIFLKWSPLFLFNNLIRFPLFNYSTTLSLDYWLFGLNLAILFIFYLIIGKSGKEKKIIDLLSICQLFLFFTTLSYPDFSHLCFIFAPLLVLFSVFIFDWFNCKSNYKFYIIFITIFIFIFYFLFFFYSGIKLNNKSFFIFDNQSSELISFIKNNCQGKYVYAGPFLPEFYFETRKLSSGPSDWLLTNHHPEELFVKTFQGLEIYKPECAIVNYKMVKKFNYNINNPVDLYLLSHYKKIKEFGTTLILKR